MNSTTLRGIFPDPKPVLRRNFMQENKKLIKQIEKKCTKFQHPIKAKTTHRPVSHILAPVKVKNQTTKIRPTSLTTQVGVKKSFDKGVQTDSFELSPKVVRKSPKRPAVNKTLVAAGDHVDKLAKNFNKLDLEEKTHTLRSKKQETNRQDAPKSSKNRKVTEPQTVSATEKTDLVLLPDEERREYLRVARENYAGLIKELNTMPIRSDTLRKRNRKMQIELELKRLDEVIKIFQKPKVFVKAD